MTLTANVPWDDGIKDMLKEVAPVLNEQYKECLQCGCPFITCKQFDGDLCIECAGTHESWNHEKRLEQQRIYQRKYVRVKRDRRRKENKHESKSEV